MSKERALLKEALYVIGEYTEDAQERTEILIDEIEKLLDQPEQTEQEPVAWMQDSIELYVQESKDTIRGYVIPLYTAPPKREPLSDLRIRAANRNEYFEWGVRFAEKAHGITGGGDV